MAVEPTNPIPLDSVMSFDNCPVEKRNLTDILLASLRNCQLKNVLKSLSWQIYSFRLRMHRDGSIDCYISFDGFTSIQIILIRNGRKPKPMLESLVFNRVYVSTIKLGVEVSDSRKIMTPRLTIRMFLLHFMEILNVPSIELEVDTMLHTIDSLQEILQGIKVHNLVVDADLIGNEQYLNSLFNAHPSVSKIRIEAEKNIKAISDEILRCHFDELAIRTCHDWSLDQLSFINSKFVFLTCQNTQEKVLNRFVKLWQGGSNPQILVLQIHINEMNTKWNIEALMAGIFYQEHDGKRKQSVAFDNKLFNFTGPQRLLAIGSNNGRTATLQIRDSDGPNGIASFTIFVNNPTYFDKDGVSREYLEMGGMRVRMAEKNYVWYDFSSTFENHFL